MSDIDFNWLKEHLSYNQETGTFTWIKSPGGNIVKGMKTGCKNGKNYLLIGVKGKCYSAHRLAWLLAYGTWPENEIDHINKDPSDNRLVNLRLATRNQNNQNRKQFSNNSSGHTGVRWHERDKRWHAYIGINKKIIFLGGYKIIEDAISARKKAEKELFTHAPLH
jgi:hypothetical protein